MTGLDIFLIAISLSLDAFAVSLTIGILHGCNIRDAFKVGLFFGGFQALMPCIGWVVGYRFGEIFAEYGHSIGFVLLLGVGLKMLQESLKEEKEEKEGKEDKNMLAIKMLTMLAVATSIDALVVGMTFSFLRVDIVPASIIIGIATFCISILGVFLGAKTKHLANVNVEIAGAVILILLSFKILFF